MAGEPNLDSWDFAEQLDAVCSTNQVVHDVYKVPLRWGKLEDNNCKKSWCAWWAKFNVGKLLSFRLPSWLSILQQTETNSISYINCPPGTCFLHHPMSSHHDFASQEPENLGQSAREVQPTTWIGVYSMFYKLFDCSANCQQPHRCRTSEEGGLSHKTTRAPN